MQITFRADPVTLSVVGQQSVDFSQTYRPLFQLQVEPFEDVLLCMNIITAEQIAFSKREYELYFGGTALPQDDSARYLIAHWFLVPRDFDDRAFALGLHRTMDALNRVTAPKPFRTFEILPTTACNARCYYCIEHGTKFETMSFETAAATVDYIDKHCDPETRRIRLRWFGGEPLCNMKVMDYITQELQNRGITFVADIVTNGYLFDEESVQKAKDFWLVKRVQITLDGTEEIYNRVKNYPYGGNAFARVVNNIGLLLDAGIEVRVRLNLDVDNFDDLKTLIGDLKARFGEKKGFSVYVARLWDESCARISDAPDADRRRVYEEQLKLQQLANGNERTARMKLNVVAHKRLNHCMANTDGGIVILPSGKLAKCDFRLSDHFVGDVWHDALDANEINWYKQTVLRLDECADCKYCMLCRYPQCCMIMPKHCDSFDKEVTQRSFREEMILTYQFYQKEHTS